MKCFGAFQWPEAKGKEITEKKLPDFLFNFSVCSYKYRRFIK